MNWEIHFKNLASPFDMCVPEERTTVQANTEEDARAAAQYLLGRFGYITEVRNLTAPEPVANGSILKGEL